MNKLDEAFQKGQAKNTFCRSAAEEAGLAPAESELDIPCRTDEVASYVTEIVKLSQKNAELNKEL